MDKSLEKSLTLWLKQQQTVCAGYLKLTVLFGILTGLCLLAQAYTLASVLDGLIMQQLSLLTFYPELIALLSLTIFRALLAYAKESSGFIAGKKLRAQVRQTVLNKLISLGPSFINTKPAGTWANIVLEQIEDLHDFYAKYLPAMMLAGFIPLIILAAIVPINWLSAMILLVTAPLIPLFMVLVGMGAAEANRKNFSALQQLNGHFLDSLRGLRTLILFHRQQAEIDKIANVSNDVKQRTMSVLSLAFLSSAVLEFFAAISIAILAVYFGFSFLGHLEWGSFSLLPPTEHRLSLFSGLFVLLLAPEFYQPLKDLGTHYHAKAKAIGAAESLVTLLNIQDSSLTSHITTSLIASSKASHTKIDLKTWELEANNLKVFTHDGECLLGPISFTISGQQKLAVVGASGSGKTTLVNLLLGFLPYEGSLKIQGIEFNQLDLSHWRNNLAWLGQEPQLFHGTLMDNLRLGNQTLSTEKAWELLAKANIDDFVSQHPLGLKLSIGEQAAGISVGQAQRIALARALSRDANVFILDEPTASLDSASADAITQSLTKETTAKCLLIVTHKLSQLGAMDTILVLEKGQLNSSGSYDELMAQNGLFCQLNAQTAYDIDLQTSLGLNS
ncbi:heme ABC transporter permease/ATP-binding protein CydD [Shewanella sp. SR44-3]|uniref:heme ABC transporter permease/ATP-binding protein CydD n=1 Tax=Shewanella sp. SR44-3 TaxID=2760936 RepID=UPI0015FA366C|nr:cysteine/glutathione ABC transporter permease/ATP-binding protein CydD [Shewanella sp. SR44-3]MBB1268920.1 cysteine/glutathione ABC transporter permease/ATP-binding protein CydD [Shewanella sp. SR44-3]